MIKAQNTAARLALPGVELDTTQAPERAAEVRLAGTKSWAGIFSELFKARLTSLVLLTTLVGWYVGTRGAADFVLMVHTLLGTALVASGASALNQLIERVYDARMRRTRERPLPAGQLEPRTVLRIGCGSAAVGVIYLALFVNPLTSAVGAASLLSYLFIYTPLKRRTWLNTLAGTVPGGLPALMGWTAARGELSREGLVLFGILAMWQVPHFMAIAWIYRDEYAAAGFKMLPVLDPDGWRTGLHALLCALALLSVSACPFVLGMAGTAYLAGAMVLGGVFAGLSGLFLARRTVRRARQLFYMSLLYLPLLLGVMVLDKIR
jgi:heme o synthase